MKEKLFNLFLFVLGDIMHEIGAVCHEQTGSDAQKLAFLQPHVAADFLAAKRYAAPDRYILAGDRGAAAPGGLRYQSYLQLAAMGRQTEFFDEGYWHSGKRQSCLRAGDLHGEAIMIIKEIAGLLCWAFCGARKYVSLIGSYFSRATCAFPSRHE